MEYLLSFFEWLGDALSSLWDFLSSTFENLSTFVKYLANAVSLAYEIIATLPTWLQGFAIITLLVSLVYLIVGRSTGGDKSD